MRSIDLLEPDGSPFRTAERIRVICDSVIANYPKTAMPKTSRHQPQPVSQVMVSSTFTDLRDHRAALIASIHGHKLHANVMENDSARLVDVIESSLQMVRQSAAYIGVIGLKYGQTPECPKQNPGKLSITELEFNEAQSLGRPILLFIMGDDHAVKKADIEGDPEKEKKLSAFRERAKNASPDSSVHRVYAIFNSLDEFKAKLGPSLAELSKHLDGDAVQDQPDPSKGRGGNPVPQPPAFYAEPDYIGSHKFIGRAAELQTLSDWAAPADPTNLLLFEAIGGNGKSILTWEWTTNPKHALAARPADSPWAGRFWYSFYERGAIMADFCQRALAYMTGQPLEHYAKKKTAELRDELLAQLHARPWLLILDGLERVLVAYHRIDAAEVPDEEANAPTDKIANRNPCDAIRDEDNDLLRALAAAAPSKLLVSSRLTPRVLLNPSGQPIPGARRITLPGLRPPDAEALLRSCGIEGNSAAIQSYLATNCDNHPLVIGILGGLIANYLPDRGNFDTWSAAPAGGAALDLASVNLIQRRNHILRAALDALPDASRHLLSTLALLTDSVDYETIKAFNPHLPPELEEVERPTPPEEEWDWDDDLPKSQKAKRRKQFDAAVARWNDNEKAAQARLASAEYRIAPKKLEATVRDLEQRGLLQWDGREKKYDLHPVVRGVASGGMSMADRERHGQRVVDHFTAQPHRPYNEAETMEDVRSGLHVVRTLLKLKRRREALNAFGNGLSFAIDDNLGLDAIYLSVLRQFFQEDWETLIGGLSAAEEYWCANAAGGALSGTGAKDEALSAYHVALSKSLEFEDWHAIRMVVTNTALVLSSQHRYAREDQWIGFAMEMALLMGDRHDIFRAKLDRFVQLSKLGHIDAADKMWVELDAMGRDWPRCCYRKGSAERHFARSQYVRGTLHEAQLRIAERLTLESKNRGNIRSLHCLRGDWRLDEQEWAMAATSYEEAVRLARERSFTDAHSETGLALAKQRLGQLSDSRGEAERLGQLNDPANRYLALLWLAIGDAELARRHALAAYRWAWADGEPYVHRYELTKTTELLQQMNVPIPNLPPYDPAKDEKLPWEDEVVAAIAKLRAEKDLARREKDQ